MSADVLSIISLVCFIIASACLILTVVLWFRFKILQVINDLTGRSARKSIEQMRQANEKSGLKSFRPSTTNAKRGKLTETMAQKKAQQPAGADDRPGTGVLAENRGQVSATPETSALDLDETSMLLEEEGTVALDQYARSAYKRSGGKKLTMLNEVILTHTDEVIE